MNDLQKKVFLDRYALKGEKGELLEHNPQEMWKRVAGGIAKTEKDCLERYLSFVKPN